MARPRRVNRTAATDAHMPAITGTVIGAKCR